MAWNADASASRWAASMLAARAAIVGVWKISRSGSFDVQLLADPRQRLRGQQRVPAQFEETVVDPDPARCPGLRTRPGRGSRSSSVRGAT